ncbi:MAG: hypothetical protein R2875_10600 [Desulfobacterales bacterium]
MAEDGWLESLFFVMTRDDAWPGPKGRMNADFIADNILVPVSISWWPGPSILWPASDSPGRLRLPI